MVTLIYILGINNPGISSIFINTLKKYDIRYSSTYTDVNKVRLLVYDNIMLNILKGGLIVYERTTYYT